MTLQERAEKAVANDTCEPELTIERIVEQIREAIEQCAKVADGRARAHQATLDSGHASYPDAVRAAKKEAEKCAADIRLLI